MFILIYIHAKQINIIEKKPKKFIIFKKNIYLILKVYEC